MPTFQWHEAHKQWHWGPYGRAFMKPKHLVYYLHIIIIALLVQFLQQYSTRNLTTQLNRSPTFYASYSRYYCQINSHPFIHYGINSCRVMDGSGVCLEGGGVCWLPYTLPLLGWKANMMSNLLVNCMHLLWQAHLFCSALSSTSWWATGTIPMSPQPQ